MFALNDQRVLNLGRTRGGKPPIGWQLDTLQSINFAINIDKKVSTTTVINLLIAFVSISLHK